MGIKENFGIHVFNDAVMKRMLPAEVYLSLRHTRKEAQSMMER